jgi:all-trans-8'-apo-beta-carotenal 15,15'-oxygenase
MVSPASEMQSRRVQNSPIGSVPRAAAGALLDEDLWLRSIHGAQSELHAPQLAEVIEGAIPADLHGTLLRNGPGSLSVQGTPLKNLIDGPGFVQAVCLHDGRATVQARFVETQTKQREDAAGRPLFGTFSQPPPYRFFDILRGRMLAYPANTNFVAHGGIGLALYENDWPYEIDLATLETSRAHGGTGHTNLGILRPSQCFSAHPRHHAESHSLYNLGCEHRRTWSWSEGVAAQTVLSLYRRDLSGTTVRCFEKTLRFPAALVHDMVLTANKAVILVSPLVLAPTLGVVLGLQSPDHAVKWRPELHSDLLVFDLQTQQMEHHTLPASLCFHLVNAFVTDGTLKLDACQFDNADVVRITADMLQGRPVAHHQAQLVRWQADAQGCWQSQPIGNVKLDWPRVAPADVGRPYRFIYGNTWDRLSALPDLPVRVDLDTQQAEVRPLARPGLYAGEPLPVPKAPHLRVSPSDVYILQMVDNVLTEASELHIYDGAQPTSPPLCRLQMPVRLPYGFHTNWLDAHDKTQTALA